MTTISEALKCAIGDQPWLTTIGVGSDDAGREVLYVYTARKLGKREATLVPRVFDGRCVLVKTMGKLRPC